MPTSLEEIGTPLVGDGIEFGIQATGANNRTITRRYKMRVADQLAYIVPIINATLFDPVYSEAVIIGQRMLPLSGNKVDCVLERTFAETPSQWDDFVDDVVTFPGVEP